MTYQLVLYQSASDDLEEAFLYLFDRAPKSVESWFERLQEEIRELSRNATIHSLAEESRKAKLPLRRAVVGKSPYQFRVIYMIVEDEVHVLRVLRGQRQFLTRQEINEAIATKPKSDDSDPRE